MNEKKILGYRKFTSKAGRPCCVLQTAYPFSEREIASGATGNKVEEVWLPDECHNLVNPSIIDKVARFDYTISNRRAYIAGVTFK